MLLPASVKPLPAAVERSVKPTLDEVLALWLTQDMECSVSTTDMGKHDGRHQGQPASASDLVMCGSGKNYPNPQHISRRVLSTGLKWALDETRV